MDNKNLYYDSTEGDNLYKYEDNQLNLDSATPEDVIEDWVYRDPVTREVQVGTMPIIDENRIRVEPGEEYHIPKGYHPGTEVVYVGSLSDFTYGTATPEDVIEGKIFWVNGERLVGTREEGPTDQSATATSDDIREGKTAWVNKTKVIGNLPSSPRKDMSLTAGSSYTIPRGIESGDSVISAIDLATQTQGTATSDHIFKDEIAWVNGVKVIGEYDIDTYVQDYLSETDANQEDVRSSKKFYSSSVGRVSNGSMTEYLNQPTKNILNGQTYAIPKGYHDGNGKIQVSSLAEVTPGTATANKLLHGETAWVNGVQITGEMYQYVTDASDTTATEYDIREGKTAYIQGHKVTGMSKYDIVSWIATDTNLLDETGVAIEVPESRWEKIYYIRIDVYENDVIKNIFTKENLLSGEIALFDNDNISINTVYGDGTINFEDKLKRKFYVTMIGYSIIPQESIHTN